MMVQAFNSDLSGYEPVIEPWNLTFVVKQSESTIVKLMTDKMLAINVSKSLIDTAFNIKSFAEELTTEVLEALGLSTPTSVRKDTKPFQARRNSSNERFFLGFFPSTQENPSTPESWLYTSP